MLYHRRKNDKNEKENTKNRKECWYKSVSDMNAVRHNTLDQGIISKKGLGARGDSRWARERSDRELLPKLEIVRKYG